MMKLCIAIDVRISTVDLIVSSNVLLLHVEPERNNFGIWFYNDDIRNVAFWKHFRAPTLNLLLQIAEDISNHYLQWTIDLRCLFGIFRLHPFSLPSSISFGDTITS